ncbi:hypothetical protein B0A48_09991 [Cryoendolithus antarcticus]|uniref:DH domain-containing protein n=1 Tax=Cryoendolithus antarcticus TaxID=1507870 RepID=A0A1V8T3A2_9PEZI|nr:hypothetical protein B0A48_09991 [Cryoendolithus antarcticus]
MLDDLRYEETVYHSDGIAGWNAAGGGIAQKQDEVVVTLDDESAMEGAHALDDDVVVVSSEHGEESEVKLDAKPKTPVSGVKPSDDATKAKKTAKEVDLEKKAWVRRKSKAANELDEAVKQAVTPKKRVVSDGHWRRDRTLPTPSPEKEATPKPIVIKRSVVNVGLKVPPSIQNWVQEIEPEPVRRQPLRPRSRSRSREPRDATPDYEDSGTKIYVRRKQRTTSSAQAAKKSRSSEGGSSVTFNSSAVHSASTAITAPDLTPEAISRGSPGLSKQKTPRNSLPAEEKPHRRSSPPQEALREMRRATRKKSEAEGAETEVKPTPVAPLIIPKIFSGRIEGWLATTSDPFSEPSLAPEPLSISRKSTSRRHEDVTSEVTDESYVKTRRSSDRRRSRPSMTPIDVERAEQRRTSERASRFAPNDQEQSGNSSPNLHRRGARRAATSPVKSRELCEILMPEKDCPEPQIRDRPATAGRASSRTLGARPQPLSHRRLSTIASADTLTNVRDFGAEGSIISHASDGDDPHRAVSLKRRLTKHSDLMSVLSLPRAERNGIESSRSIRTQRARPGEATIADIMNEVTSDELKYQRELRTLVDGVIPVLLQSVLSPSTDPAVRRVSAALGRDETTATQPVVNMGVALERLKTAHKRIPMHDPAELVTWAQSTSKIYDQYLQAWRMGFQDIVVNLAAAEGVEKQRTPSYSKGPAGRSVSGTGDGERVEVAYLLKRPLIRLKYLAKTLKSVDQVTPGSGSRAVAAAYHDLVEEAKKRSNEERARLEDEAAFGIDPTRARDPRTLGPLSGVAIDATRCVRARDYFDLDMRHSSGQQLTCKIEVIIRDDGPGRGNASDLLFCEVSTTGRWLLFPPVLASAVSARSGKANGEMKVMLRGTQPNGKEWREVLSLQSSDDGAVPEWLDMLPSSPVPPSLMKKSSFDMLKMSGAMPAPPASPDSMPREVQIPIGERARSSAKVWDGSDVNSTVGGLRATATLKRAKAARYPSTPSSPLTQEASRGLDEEYAWEKGQQSRERPKSMFADPSMNQRSQYARSATEYTASTVSADWTMSSGYTTPKKDYSVWLPSSQANSDDEHDSGEENDKPKAQRPGMHRRTSSVPALDMPTVNKLRKAQKPPTTPPQPSRHIRGESAPIMVPTEPTSAPAKLQKRQTVPPKPEERSSRDLGAKTAGDAAKPGKLASFTPAFLQKHRRSSSPLKHEYEPSTASDSGSEDSNLSDIEDDESVTSEESGAEQISTLGPLKAFPTYGGYTPMVQPTPPQSQYTPSGASIAPSQSASQGPYRSVPVVDSQAAQTVASLFAWADDTGAWVNLHPDECSIVVTPGLIEAFDMAQALGSRSAKDADATQSPSTRGVKPLVALELTPLVPLRRGTALDISIRSPPTSNSMYKTSPNVMFRSRSPEDCETLYHLLNRARINNPTYIALQHARGPSATSNWGETMAMRNAARGASSSSWFNLPSRKGSYRSKGERRVVSAADTASSIGTMNSAFSALRRFSGSGKIFNIAKSTISTREGGARSATYSDSLSSGATTPLPVDPRLGTPLGLTNMKIRFYVRETAGKWRDLGSARLNILLPPRLDPTVPADPRVTGREKRVVVQGKTQGEVLLDATLGETCFERVARTGIAVSVWEELVGANGEKGHVGHQGGVLGARATVYMVQMKSERDTAYTFGLVGKLRY